MMPRLTPSELRSLIRLANSNHVQPSPYLGISLEHRHPDFCLGAMSGFENLWTFTRRVMETHDNDDTQDIIELLTIMVCIASAHLMSQQADLPPEYFPCVRQINEIQLDRNLELDLSLLTPNESVHYHAGLCAALLEANDLLYLHNEADFLLELRSRTVAILQRCQIVIVRRLPYSKN